MHASTQNAAQQINQVEVKPAETPKPRKYILIGSGFLGSYIVGDILRFPENELLIVDMRNDSSVRSHPVVARYNGDSRLRTKWQSAGDAVRLFREIKEADVIINTAAIADVPLAMGSPQMAINTNVVNTVQLMEVIRAADFAGRFIHLSSESIYGHQPVDKLPIKEDAPCDPANIYGASKLMQELAVRSYHKSYGIRTIVLRSGTLYGPGAREKQAIPIFIKQALMNEPITLEGDGSQTRDFNYVTNMMDAVRLASTHKGTDIDGEVFNISMGREIRFVDLVNAIRTIVRSESRVAFNPWRPGEQGLRVWMDISKAREKLNYEPLIDMIPAGLRNTILYVLGTLPISDSERERITQLVAPKPGSQKIGDTVRTVEEKTS